MNPQTLKYWPSSLTLLYIRSYTFDCFFRSLCRLKKEFGQIKESIKSQAYKIFKLSELWVPWGVAGYKSQYEFNSTTCLWEVPVIRSDLKSISKSKQHEKL